MAFHICLAADENYVKYAAVLMTSIVRNIDKNISFESLFDYQSNEKNTIIAPSIRAVELLKDYKKRDFNSLKEEEKEEKIIFHLLSDFIKPETQIKLKELEKELCRFYSTEIQTHIFSDEIFKDCPKWYNGSLLTHFRLFITQMFEEVDTILYLDVDMLVCCDIRSLWTLDLNNVFAAVVHDWLKHAHSKRPALNQNEKEFFFGDFYFNAGFMLINLKEWRSYDILGRYFNFLEHYKPIAPNQDPLNYALQEKVLVLPVNFDFFIILFENKDLDYTIDEQDSCNNNPVIMHFSGYTAPWKNPFLFQNKSGDFLDVFWFDCAEKIIFKNEIFEVVKNRILEMVILDKLFEYSQSFLSYFKVPFLISKINREIKESQKQRPFYFSKILQENHFSMNEKFKVLEIFNTRFQKALTQKSYLLKLPFSLFVAKRYFLKMVENTKNKNG